jgi:hypothetical protein
VHWVCDRAGPGRISRYRCAAVLPLRNPYGVDVPNPCFFRGRIPGPHVPLSTLRCYPCEQHRMTWGRCGSLTLQRMTLSFTAPHRDQREATRFCTSTLRDTRARLDRRLSPCVRRTSEDTDRHSCCTSKRRTTWPVCPKECGFGLPSTSRPVCNLRYQFEV